MKAIKNFEERRRRIAAMDEIIGLTGDKDVMSGWDAYTKGRTYPEITGDAKIYSACCRYFEMIIGETDWAGV